jgi:hypothetical protein
MAVALLVNEPVGRINRLVLDAGHDSGGDERPRAGLRA